jgi:diacylglycerol kinase family enzyme
MSEVIEDITKMKVGALINTSSGGCDVSSEEKMENLLKEAGIQSPHIWCGGADAVIQSLKEAVTEKFDLFIVLGGDGTIRSAAEAYVEHGPVLLPLPGGTMNVLPKALYGDLSWEEVLTQTLKAPAIQILSGGRVRGKKFYITAIVGAPALWAEARESVREGDFGKALEKSGEAIAHMFEKMVTFKSPELEGETEALAIICPFVSQELPNTAPTFEVAVIKVENVLEAISLATYGAFGRWRDHARVELTKTRVVEITSGKKITAINDCERVNLNSPSRFEFLDEAVKVLVPHKG